MSSEVQRVTFSVEEQRGYGSSLYCWQAAAGNSCTATSDALLGYLFNIVL